MKTCFPDYVQTFMQITSKQEMNHFKFNFNVSYFKPSSIVFVMLSLIVGLTLAGCAEGMQIQPAEEVAPPVPQPGDLVSIESYSVPTPEPEPTPDPNVLPSISINTGGSRANLRDEPSTDSNILAKGLPGDVFQVVAKTEDGQWLQLCCIQDAEGAQLYAWISASLTSPAEEGTGDGEIPVVDAQSDAVLAEDMSAEWVVDWSCNSDRCEVSTCEATVTASVSGTAQQQWIPIEHRVRWGETCFSEDAWVFEINRFTGAERTGEFSENFLYSYWLGNENRSATNVFILNDTQGVAVECAGPYEVEIEEGDGWTTVYEGETCHDLRTGMLIFMQYTKRWLFTGEYEGQQYDRAYFGDSEKLIQQLAETNSNLMVVEKR